MRIINHLKGFLLELGRSFAFVKDLSINNIAHQGKPGLGLMT